MNPANEQRLIDTLGEARKHPGLEQGMVPWYVMDPAYQRMVQLVGPERAAKEYRDFNMSMTPFSAGSSVPSEINRGTAANMMRERGEYDMFKKYGGLAADKRDVAAIPEILRTSMASWVTSTRPTRCSATWTPASTATARTRSKSTYTLARPACRRPASRPAARCLTHTSLARSACRTHATSRPATTTTWAAPSIAQIGPWYRQKIAKPLGIEAVPAQALMWGTYGPQTGVKTKIGAGKLELMSKQMWERAQQARRRSLRISRPGAARRATFRTGRRQPWHG